MTMSCSVLWGIVFTGPGSGLSSRVEDFELSKDKPCETPPSQESKESS